MTATESEDSQSAETGSQSNGAELVERTIIVASVLIIAAMLGYMLLETTTGPSSPDPSASVDTIEPRPNTDQLLVTIVLTNRGDRGVSTVQVGVRCGDQTHTLEFTNLPGSGSQSGTVVCPSGTTPEASVESWIEA
jgi:hypothetical protein